MVEIGTRGNVSQIQGKKKKSGGGRHREKEGGDKRGQGKGIG